MPDPTITLDTSKEHQIGVRVNGVLYGTMTGPHPAHGGGSCYQAIKGTPLTGRVFCITACPLAALAALKAEIMREGG